VTSFAVYLAFKILREKRIIFFSASWGNYAVLLLTLATAISLAFSASRIDSLFGYDLSFASSSIIIFAAILLYFVLKLAGLSLEVAVSRVLSVLPLTLLLINFTSLFLYVLPVEVLERLLGNYSAYFSHFSTAPFSLLGNTQQALFIHVIAVVVALFQLAAAQKKGKSAKGELIKRGILSITLGIVLSYLIYTTFSFSLFGTAVYVAALLIALFTAYSFSQKEGKFMLVLFVGAMVAIAASGIIWNKAGVIGQFATPVLPIAESSSIITQSFLNGSTPMWRQLTGFGVSTFPYLYMQYRSVDAAKAFGNTTFFFRPNEFITELFVEQGALAVIAFVVLIFVTVKAFIKASAKKQLLLEVTLLLFIVAFLGTSPSSLLVLATLFIVLASFFDKVESQPEMLPAIHALDIKESFYTNRTISRGNQALLAAAVVLFIVTSAVLAKPTATMISYVRAAQRLNVSAQENSKENNTAVSSKTLISAYTIALSAKNTCNECSQLNNLKLNSLLSLYAYYDGLTGKDRENSNELRQVKNMLLQSVTDLTAQNPARYDYWLSIAQAYKLVATDEKASSFYVLSVQSLKNSLKLNQYSIDASLLYIETLLSIGNDNEINTEIATQVSILKSIVGSPIQVQYYEGILLARAQKYTEAIATFEGIKKEVEATSQFTVEQKAAYIKLIDAAITDITKAEVENKKPAVTPTPSVTVTPSVTPTVNQ
jgi:hypothetical protein